MVREITGGNEGTGTAGCGAGALGCAVAVCCEAPRRRIGTTCSPAGTALGGIVRSGGDTSCFVSCRTIGPEDGPAGVASAATNPTPAGPETPAGVSSPTDAALRCTLCA